MTTMEFSLKRLFNHSGSGQTDLDYIQYFCKEAITRAEVASQQLAKLSNLEEWGNAIEATADSNMAYILAIVQSFSDANEFFSNMTDLATPIKKAASEADKIYNAALDDYKKISCWVNTAKNIQ